MRASIIIVSYNGRQYLEGCLSSLRSDMRDGEVIVVDNASTDGSVEWLQTHFPEVRLICNPRNRGFAAACNQGAEAARGEVLVFLNQDTRVAPGWLAPLVGALEEGEKVGLTTSKVLLMSHPGRIHLCGQDVHYTGLVFSRGFYLPESEFNHPEEVGAVSGASFAIKRDVWEILGGFDEAFYMYYEETDLCWRAQLMGYRCRFVPGSVVDHDYQPGVTSTARFYYATRNRVIMLLKNWGCATLFLLIPVLLLTELVEVSMAARQGWVGIHTKLRASFWILKHFTTVLRQREAAQSLRSIPDSEILESRTGCLTPVETPTSPLLCLVLTPLNAIFRLYYRGIVAFCQALGL
jgi:GT2 family glycosyltransferase